MLGNRKKHILFVESGALFGYSAFTQQFLMEARGLKEKNWRVLVVAFESFRDIFNKRSVMYKDVLNDSKITYFIIPSWFRENVLIEKIFNFINTAILGFFVLLKKTGIIHAHDRISAYYAIRLKRILNVKVVYDIHGINIEEQIYSNRLKENSYRHKHLNKMEHSVIKNSDSVFCVSGIMKDYLINKYNVDSSKCVVTPTGVDTNIFSYSLKRRKASRKRLGLDDKFVLLFMGHIKSWQVNDLFANLFEVFKKKIKYIHFLVLTDGREVFTEIFNRIGICREMYSIYSVKHEEVPDYAAAADAGILLRDNSIVNRVAAPAKFGEYLAMGIPVIINKGIGDTETIVKNYDVGVVLEGPDSESISSSIDTLLNMTNNTDLGIYERCSRIAQNCLSSEASVQTFLSTYNKILI